MNRTAGASAVGSPASGCNDAEVSAVPLCRSSIGADGSRDGDGVVCEQGGDPAGSAQPSLPGTESRYPGKRIVRT